MTSIAIVDPLNFNMSDKSVSLNPPRNMYDTAKDKEENTGEAGEPAKKSVFPPMQVLEPSPHGPPKPVRSVARLKEPSTSPQTASQILIVPPREPRPERYSPPLLPEPVGTPVVQTSGVLPHHPAVKITMDKMYGSSPYISGSMSAQQRRSLNRPLPRHARDVLKGWLLNNLDNPYPSELDKTQLANETGLSLTQISNWFNNARRRKLPEALRKEGA